MKALGKEQKSPSAKPGNRESGTESSKHKTS
jgi:hypothetical protein